MVNLRRLDPGLHSGLEVVLCEVPARHTIQHCQLAVGSERANGMEACATDKREGVRFSIHSDAPIAPAHGRECPGLVGCRRRANPLGPA